MHQNCCKKWSVILWDIFASLVPTTVCCIHFFIHYHTFIYCRFSTNYYGKEALWIHPQIIIHWFSQFLNFVLLSSFKVKKKKTFHWMFDKNTSFRTEYRSCSHHKNSSLWPQTSVVSWSSAEVQKKSWVGLYHCWTKTRGKQRWSTAAKISPDQQHWSASPTFEAPLENPFTMVLNCSKWIKTLSATHDRPEIKM